jgi:hypothetical protein
MLSTQCMCGPSECRWSAILMSMAVVLMVGLVIAVCCHCYAVGTDGPACNFVKSCRSRSSRSAPASSNSNRGKLLQVHYKFRTGVLIGNRIVCMGQDLSISCVSQFLARQKYYIVACRTESLRSLYPLSGV